MSPSSLHHLGRLGRTLRRWEAEIPGAWGLAGALLWLFALGLADVFLRFNQPVRWISFIGLLGLLGHAAWRCSRHLRRPWPPEAVAARIERTFPELDNHLINHLQFARTGGGNAFTDAYLSEGEPRWQDLDFRQMRDRRAHIRSKASLAGMTAAMLLFWLFLGSSWSTAVWRMVNPFTQAEPTTLTRLLEVTPGNTTVLQGTDLIISARVKGLAGHEMEIEVETGDGDRRNIAMGRLAGGGEETFAHRVEGINTPTRYRIRAGDAFPSAWFTIDTRPPPAFTGILLSVTPPPYTGKPGIRFDALSGPAAIPQGATLALSAQCNTPLASATLVSADGSPTAMEQDGDDRNWKATTTVLTAGEFTLKAVDIYGAAFEEKVAIQMVADLPPEIQIVIPQGRVQLPPGQLPRIEFSLSDDHGLLSAEVQEVSAKGKDGAGGTVLQSWPLDNAQTHAGAWSPDAPLRGEADVSYRIVVRDNCPFTEQVSRSVPLTFGAVRREEAKKDRKELEQKTAGALQKIVELQRLNVDRTKAALDSLPATKPESWNDTADRQESIRGMTREMLDNPLRPFGGLTDTVKGLYLNEMADATRMLRALPARSAEEQAPLAAQALRTEEKILEQLGYARTEGTSAAAERRSSALSTMLNAMIKEQENILKQTRSLQEKGAKVAASLVDAQDALPSDLTSFREACADEAELVRGSDEAFAATLADVAARCDSLKIRDQMVLAAERLDQNLPAEAIPFEDTSLKALESLRDAMENAAVKQEGEKRAVLGDALTDARERLERIRELRARMLESMDAVRGQEDQGAEQLEQMEEAYEELVRNTQEAMLEIPVDLHTFADTLAANDLVEDIFQIFQEVEQEEGTETGDQDAKLMDYAKEDANLELMDEAIERIGELETWLLENPDEKRVTAEAFDREEMPDEGVAKGELGEAVEDLISDLLDEDEQQEEEAQDSASTHGVTDMETGWGVEEGETITFSAKGKSGNRTPDHKEQDGRSIVGRQGMAVGETAAASGTINKGDDDIEARRTEDPTMAGKIELDGEADTRATGGGKKGSGKADDLGMSGGVKRIDSDEQGSAEGMAALMARRADQIYAQASLKNVRVDALKQAAHHLRQSGDAVASGDIGQVKEFRRLAVVALQQARVRLDAGPAGNMQDGGAPKLLDGVVEGGPDMAPADYRDQVAEYYRALNDLL